MMALPAFNSLIKTLYFVESLENLMLYLLIYFYCYNFPLITKSSLLNIFKLIIIKRYNYGVWLKFILITTYFEPFYLKLV